jgi:hypothetical protein
MKVIRDIHFYLLIYTFKPVVASWLPSKGSMEFRKGSPVSNWSPHSDSPTWDISRALGFLYHVINISYDQYPEG